MVGSSFFKPEMIKINFNTIGKEIQLFFIVLFILSTANAFFIWYFDSTLYYAVFFVGMPFVTFGVFQFRKIVIKHAIFPFLLLLLYLYIMIPFREYDSTGFSFLFCFTLFFLFFINYKDTRKIIDLLAIVIAVVACSASIVFFFNLIGIDLPWIRLPQNFRSNAYDYYRLYPGSLVLSEQVWRLGYSTIVRTSGILREPGHFAMFCGAVLVADGFTFSKKRYGLIALGGFLTMSPAFFLLFILGYLITMSNNCINIFKVGINITLLLIGFVVAIQAAPEELYHRLVIKNTEAFHVGGIQGVLNRRTHGSFEQFYEKLTFQERLVGLGSQVFENTGYHDAQASDYRGFVSKNGYIALMLLFGLFLYIAFKSNNKRTGWLIFVFFAIVATHRSWMLTQVWFPFLTSVIWFKKKAPMVTPVNKNLRPIGGQPSPI